MRCTALAKLLFGVALLVPSASRRPAASAQDVGAVPRSTRVALADGQPSLSANRAENPQQWFRPLREIDMDPHIDEGKIPPDLSVRLFLPPRPGAPLERFGHVWPEHAFGWAASELEHQPLYFDDVPLENYGQTVCPLAQPALSAARFFGSLPVIPYKMGLDHPYDRVSTLGTYRVGTCAPCTHQSLPFGLDAATLEAGTWVGMVFLLP
ncbi:MAG: hypothetical protein ACC645_17970 [Pirellulales bacterium]